MALFAIHLVRIVLTSLLAAKSSPASGINFVLIFVIAFHQMFNVIIRSVHFYSFVLLITFTWLGHRTNNYFCAGRNGIVLQ